MKILHIISSFDVGGAEIYVRDLSVGMKALGHELCIVYISEIEAINGSKSFEGEFIQILKNNNIEYYNIGHACKKNVLLGAFRLRKIVGQFKPDIIHSHLYFGLIFLGLSLTKIPIVYTHHTQFVKNKFIFKFFNLFVNQYIAISQDCRKSLQLTNSMKINTVYNGVDSSRIHLKKKFHINKVINVISVGNFHECKNYTLLVDSVSKLLEKYPSLSTKVVFSIVGSGTQFDEINNKIISMNLINHIKLLGTIQNVGELLNQSELFLMTSDFEGLPIALIEALMTGLPAVVTDVGGCRDLVERCEAGVVVSPNDVNKMVKALYALLNDFDKLKKLSNNARLNAQVFDIKYAIDSHLKIYSSLKK